MKKLIFGIMMLFCISCTNDKPLTDAEKQQITTEVKAVTDQIFRLAEAADFESMKEIFYVMPGSSMLTPDGKKIPGEEWVNMIGQMFSVIKSQQISTVAENYNVLDRSTVYYSNVSNTRVNFKDSSVVQQNPWSAYFLFRKIDDKWRWVEATEYGHEEILKPKPASKELNQKELAKQMLGMWRCEYGDTVQILDVQPFGESQLAKIMTNVKGKPFREDRVIAFYDGLHDALSFAGAGKDGSGGIMSMKFNSPTTYTAVRYLDVAMPAYARWTIQGEFVDKDKYVEKLILNNETVATYTTTRIK